MTFSCLGSGRTTAANYLPTRVQLNLAPTTIPSDVSYCDGGGGWYGNSCPHDCCGAPWRGGDGVSGFGGDGASRIESNKSVAVSMDWAKAVEKECQCSGDIAKKLCRVSCSLDSNVDADSVPKEPIHC
mmetsp:Transcript_5501/g.11246  ORF Transcript_5501/g.11246 Transcript_5501/m.11246 type:complete len:128 (+) Transcript_5501:102-485(+)